MVRRHRAEGGGWNGSQTVAVPIIRPDRDMDMTMVLEVVLDRGVEPELPIFSETVRVLKWEGMLERLGCPVVEQMAIESHKRVIFKRGDVDDDVDA